MAGPLPYFRFPPLASAGADGLIALTTELSRPLLVSAYRQGIFPWVDEPVGWFAPPTRAILVPEEARFPSNFAKLMRRADFWVSFDTCFERVINACAATHAPKGAWLTPRFVAAYIDLWRAGYGHSVELWQGNALVGGLYGVQVGSLFCAESMFAAQANASKAALHALLGARAQTGVTLVDVQVLNDTTERLGARGIPRAAFMRHLAGCSVHFEAHVGRLWPKPMRRLCEAYPITPRPAAPGSAPKAPA